MNTQEQCEHVGLSLYDGMELSRMNKMKHVVLISGVGCSDCSMRDWFYACEKDEIDNRDYIWTFLRVGHSSYDDVVDSTSVLYADNYPRIYILDFKGNIVDGPQYYATDSVIVKFIKQSSN